MITIRKLQSNDNLADVSRIYAKSWKFAYRGIIPQDYLDSIPEDNWVKVLENPERHTLVVVEGENIIGTTSCGKSRTPEYEEWGEIYSLYLLPEYMGKGYGKQLISAALDELRKLGYTNFFLWVLEDNIRAIKFYESTGFVRTGKTKEIDAGEKFITEVMCVMDARYAD